MKIQTHLSLSGHAKLDSASSETQPTMKIHNISQQLSQKLQSRQHMASKTPKPMTTNQLHQTSWNKTQINRHQTRLQKEQLATKHMCLLYLLTRNTHWE